MKKSVIIVTALVYVLSIIIVAILGFVAETKNPPILVEEIVMRFDDAENFPEEPYVYYYNGAPIYEVTYNSSWAPVEEELDESSETISSTTKDETYKYRIKFYGSEEFEYYQENIGTVKLNTFGISSRGEPENSKLSYYIDKDKADILTVDKEGIVELKKYQTYGDYDVRVSTNDGSKLSININIYW